MILNKIKQFKDVSIKMLVYNFAASKRKKYHKYNKRLLY